jgi:FAD/FMN-containing dehydrogenase
MDPVLEIVAALRDAIGGSHVASDPSSLEQASTATFAAAARVAAIAWPADSAEVRACLAVARRFRLPVYPVSRGKNWGLGSRVPTRDQSLLLDLGRMNGIVDFDEQMAWVTVEPGVTFAALYDFLRARGARLFANATGASPEASVVGNALERGDGAGPYGDRASYVCALEVVLPTGECVHTGFGRFEKNPLAPLARWGVGPALDGLFSQSNLGIVTRMTLWLTPLPRSLAAVRFSIVDAERLAPLVEALRELRLEGTLRSVTGLWNDYRVLSTRGQYPWQLTGGKTPLMRAVLDTIRDEWGGGRWFGLTALYAASAEQGAAHRARVERVIAPLVDHLSIEARDGEPVSGHELFHEQDPAFQFLQGIPHEGSLKSVYWRKRTPPALPLDPERDRCGVLWACPALPFRGADAERGTALAEQVMLEHGFEPLLAMIAQTERVLYLVPLITYDRDVAGEDARALACHDALLERAIAEGYLPYRLGIQSMNALPAPRDDWAAVLRRIKRAFDPDDVLAPGRYDFRDAWPDDDD